MVLVSIKLQISMTNFRCIKLLSRQSLRLLETGSSIVKKPKKSTARIPAILHVTMWIFLNFPGNKNFISDALTGCLKFEESTSLKHNVTVSYSLLSSLTVNNPMHSCQTSYATIYRTTSIKYRSLFSIIGSM